MARSKLLWYETESKAILYDISKLNQTEIAHQINETRQTVNYRLKNVYPTVLNDLIRILKMAGYEIYKGDKDGH